MAKRIGGHKPRWLSVTLWNENVEGTRVGEAITIIPSEWGFSVPHELHVEAVRWGYKTRRLVRCEGRLRYLDGRLFEAKMDHS